MSESLNPFAPRGLETKQLEDPVVEISETVTGELAFNCELSGEFLHARFHRWQAYRTALIALGCSSLIVAALWIYAAIDFPQFADLVKVLATFGTFLVGTGWFILAAAYLDGISAKLRTMEHFCFPFAGCWRGEICQVDFFSHTVMFNAFDVTARQYEDAMLFTLDQIGMGETGVNRSHVILPRQCVPERLWNEVIQHAQREKERLFPWSRKSPTLFPESSGNKLIQVVQLSKFWRSSLHAAQVSGGWLTFSILAGMFLLCSFWLGTQVLTYLEGSGFDTRRLGKNFFRFLEVRGTHGVTLISAVVGVAAMIGIVHTSVMLFFRRVGARYLGMALRGTRPDSAAKSVDPSAWLMLEPFQIWLAGSGCCVGFTPNADSTITVRDHSIRIGSATGFICYLHRRAFASREDWEQAVQVVAAFEREIQQGRIAPKHSF